MAGLENLFAAEPTLPSIQTMKMPDNPQEWPEVITTKLRERFPETAKLPLTVEFRKKDDPSGTAIGGIHVQSSETGKKLIVPFIIRKFELSPLDVWMEATTQAVHPLCNDTFKEQFFSSSPAEALDQRPADAAGQYFNDPSLWTSNYPPLQGRYSYASAGYDILDSISDTMRKEHLDEFRAVLSQEPGLIMRFQKHGHKEVIEKLAKKIPPATNSFAESALKLIPVGVMHIKKESPDKYSLLSMADQMFDIAATEYCNHKELAERVSKITRDVNPVLHDVDQEGERMCVMTPAPSKGVWLYDDMTEKAELIHDFATVCVKDKAGVRLEGVVFPHVVTFAGKKLPYKLFISPSHSSMQGSIAGIRHKDSDMLKKLMMKGAGARVGQTGTFVYIDDGKAIATEPVTMKAIVEHGPMTAVKLDGTKIQISRGFGSCTGAEPTKEKKNKTYLDAHGMIETRPHEFVIPNKMHWVPMEGFQDVSESVEGYMQKEAASHMESNPMTIRYTGIVYQTEQDDIGRNDFSERELKIVLASKGCPVEKIASIVGKARAIGRVKVHGLGKLRKKADIIKEANAVQADMEKLCKSVRVNLIKCAAEIDDATTVDVLLGLNFLNPENLIKFVSYRPVIKKINDYLAELTMASRLGLKDISESALTTAMSKLDEIENGLDRIQAGIKMPGAKTASYVPQKNAENAKTAAAQPQQAPAEGMIAPVQEDHFANGMSDGELGMPMHMESARKAGAQSLLAYMNGKRTSEQNKAQSQMALGIAHKGAPKQPQTGAKK